ncbi:hypothetical protein J2W33_003731 [Variovorax boronicumulans]|nr:hypothetical protein [Variovorax boronicumulans]
MGYWPCAIVLFVDRCVLKHGLAFLAAIFNEGLVRRQPTPSLGTCGMAPKERRDESYGAYAPLDKQG